MINEATIIEELRSTIIAELNSHKSLSISTTFTGTNVVWDIVDVDRMNSDIQLYIETDTVNLDSLTTLDDECRFGLSLAVVAKRDTKINLRDKLFEIKAILYNTFKNYSALSDYVENIEVESWYYIPSVFTEDGIAAIDLKLNLIYSIRRDW